MFNFLVTPFAMRLWASAVALVSVGLVPLLVGHRSRVQWSAIDPFYQDAAPGVTPVISDFFNLIKAEAIIGLGIISIVILLLAFINGQRYRGHWAVTWGATIFGGLLLVSSWKSPYWYTAFQGLPALGDSTFVWLSYLAILVLVHGYVDRDWQYRLLAWTFGIAATLEAVVCFAHVAGYDLLFGAPLRWLTVGQIVDGDGTIRTPNLVDPTDVPGTLGGSNFIGAYFAVAVVTFLGVYLVCNRRKFDRVLIALLVVLISALVISQSRSAYLASVIGSVLLLYQLGERAKRKMLGLFVILSGAIVLSHGLTSLQKGGIDAVLEKRLTKTISANPTSGRTEIWEKSLPQLSKKIWLGTGPTTFGLEYPDHERINHLMPHSMWLQVWQAVGMMGAVWLLLLVVGVLATFFFVFDTRDPVYLICFCGLLTFLVFGLANDATISIAVLFFGLLGVVARMGLPAVSFRVNRVQKTEYEYIRSR